MLRLRIRSRTFDVHKSDKLIRTRILGNGCTGKFMKKHEQCCGAGRLRLQTIKTGDRGENLIQRTQNVFVFQIVGLFFLSVEVPPKYRLKPYQKKIITGYAVGTLRGLAGVFLVAACTNIHIQYSITVLIIIYIHIYLHTLHYFTPVLLPPINLFRIWKFKK